MINSTLILIGAAVVVFIAIVGYASTRLKNVPPNGAIIRSGLGSGDKQAIFLQGTVLSLPIVHETNTLYFAQHQVELNVSGIDSQGISTKIDANLSFKFGDTEADIRRAAQRFLNHSDEKLENSIKKAVEASLLGVISSLTVEESYRDKEKLSDLILKVVESKLLEQGIVVDALNVNDVMTPSKVITDPSGKHFEVNYLEEIGKPSLERAKREASIAASDAKNKSEAARIAQEKATAALTRDLEIQKAQFQAETDREKAIANSARSIAEAEQDVKVAELEQKALTQKALVEQERLDIEVHKPADAQAYKARVDAQASRDAAVFKAEAAKATAIADAEGKARSKTIDAEADKVARELKATADARAVELAAAADAKSVELKAKADAEAITLHGEADASAILARGKAKAESDAAQAAALTGHTDASLRFLAVQALPEVVRASSEAVAGIDNYTVISTDGASDASKQANRMLTEGSALLGIDLKSILSGGVGALAGSLAGLSGASAAPAVYSAEESSKAFYAATADADAKSADDLKE
jgi:flotillin